MALTTCPDCGKSISTLATFCPGCGRPMKYQMADDAMDITAEIAEGKRIVCPDGTCTGVI
jgi:predicted amidophosphoribosyltransferase